MSQSSNKRPVIESEVDASENVSSNRSGNRPFREVLASHLSRRGMLTGTLAAAASSGFLAPKALAYGWDNDHHGYGWGHRHRRRDLVGFKPLTIAEATVDQTLPTISEDYVYQTFIPWGTPIEPGATEAYNGDPNTRPTPEQAALQIGIGHDGMWFFPEDVRGSHHGGYFGRRGYEGGHLSSRRGMLCVNHEFGVNTHVLGKDMPESLADVRVSQHVHGVAVVAIERRGYGWDVAKSPNARRIHVNTPVRFAGPAASSPLLQNPNGNVPLGTVNNCGSGPTPWGTYLTCEENFNGYFGANATFTPTESQARYGFSESGFNYGWHLFDRRFDLTDADYVNESNRFGWVVEIDPFDGTQVPVKRTALGRFKHEGAAVAESENGRIAVYMGDDQAGDYCYKYVSNRSWRRAIRNGESPLDDGTLYVAKFNDDGTGEWLELSTSNPALSGAFANQAELLINTRLAADIVGATPMDRPEWTTLGQNNSVFWTLTNNSGRTTPNGPNPEAPNSDGHIIKTVDSDDYLGTTFTWEIYILASSTRGTEGVFTDPDAAYTDPFGRLFIGTDGGQPDGLQDQLVVFDTTADVPEPKRLLVGVVSDEITGFTHTPDFRTAFTNVQHPGNGNPAATSFPEPFNGTTIPRDATLIITKKDGGVIGS